MGGVYRWLWVAGMWVTCIRGVAAEQHRNNIHNKTHEQQVTLINHANNTSC
jgi:hypothetical protein